MDTAGPRGEKPHEGIDGKLRIGDDWNAISIIALSQNNPLKAIAELVENSIDAKATLVTIVRGKEKGEHFIKVIDDGEGVDDLRRVATHVGDSVKRKLKKAGASGLQGEFGIGLMSFWTVGEQLVMTTNANGTAQRMTLVKNNPSFSIREVRGLFHEKGTEVLIGPLLPGIRNLSGEKLQNYLASELRDRISKSHCRIHIVDRTSRKEFEVTPRSFSGRLIHGLPEIRNPLGEIWCELYVNDPGPEIRVSLAKAGTRVLPSMSSLAIFDRAPWNDPSLEGIVDADFIDLTPGTRDGVIADEALESLAVSLEVVEDAITATLAEHRRAVEETASRSVLQRVTKAFREAFRLLPRDEYGWMGVRVPLSVAEQGRRAGHGGGTKNADGAGNAASPEDSPESFDAFDAEAGAGDPLAVSEDETREKSQLKFFEIAGPLHSVTVSPTKLTIRVGDRKRLRVVARDKSRRAIEAGLETKWTVSDGIGTLEDHQGEYCTFAAGLEPSVGIVKVTVRQGEVSVDAECIVTVTAELAPTGGSGNRKGLPGYTFVRAPGELWRSRYDADEDLIRINNAHADFIWSSRDEKKRLRYITRLFAKELVLSNFPEADRSQLLERLIELQLYAEENL